MLRRLALAMIPSVALAAGSGGDSTAAAEPPSTPTVEATAHPGALNQWQRRWNFRRPVFRPRVQFQRRPVAPFFYQPIPSRTVAPRPYRPVVRPNRPVNVGPRGNVEYDQYGRRWQNSGGMRFLAPGESYFRGTEPPRFSIFNQPGFQRGSRR